MAGAQTVLVFDDVALGGHRHRWLPRVLPVRRLHDLLLRLAQRTEVVPLGPERHTGDAQKRKQVALAFVGGYAGHATRVAPLLDALGFPGHIFVPVECIGLPGRMTLDQIGQLHHQKGVRIELDLSGRIPASCGQLATRLRQGRDLLAVHARRCPRFVWLGRGPCDPRLPLLLKQYRYAAAIARGGRVPQAPVGVPILTARPPSWLARWGWGAI